MVGGRPTADAPETGLHLVENEQDPLLVGDSAEFLEEALGRRVVTPLPLDRLDQEAGDLSG